MKLRTKLVIFFILIATVPLVTINTIWFFSMRSQIITGASVEVYNVGRQAVEEIDRYLSNKLIELIVHSQTEAVLQKDVESITRELSNFLFQDGDVQELRLLNDKGHEVIHVTRDKVFQSHELVDQSGSPAYKIATFFGGNKYMSGVYVNNIGEPVIDIAVPLVSPRSGHSLQTLSTSATGQARTRDEISGVLIETVSVAPLWKRLNELKINKNGRVYVVDDKGVLLNDPDAEDEYHAHDVSHVDEVQTYLASLTKEHTSVENVRQTIDEKGNISLTLHFHPEIEHWGIIAEVPLSDVLVNVNKIAAFAISLFFVLLIWVVVLALWLSDNTVKALEKLRSGVKVFGEGNLHYRTDIHTGDEVEELSEAFNTMASGLEESFERIKLRDKQLERERNVISAEKNKLAVVLSGITDAVIAVDLGRNILTFNSAAETMTGYKASEIIGKPIGSIIKLYDGHKELFEEEYCPIKLDDSFGVVYKKANLKVHTKKGDLHAHLIAEKIADSMDANLGCILTIHDVTQERSLEEMKLDFVAMAAHELRTPLTAVRGYLSIFINENAQKFDKEQQTFLQRIDIASQQLLTLVENLLSVSRIEKGAFTTQAEATDWPSTVRSVVEELTSRAQDKEITLTFIEPENPVPPVLADPLRITEVVSNLVVNAISYTQRKGSIHVYLEHKDNEVITHIKDTGEGIPKEAFPKLFSKFFRVAGALSHGSKGTGLGLYICKSIVEMHHGRIWVESELHKGSTFSFSLPTES